MDNVVKVPCDKKLANNSLVSNLISVHVCRGRMISSKLDLGLSKVVSNVSLFIFTVSTQSCVRE